MSWSDERIEQLRQLWLSGKSASEIAEIMGDVSRNAIIGKAHRLGLSGRPSPIRHKEQEKKVITILTLTDRMCKWPFGDPKHEDFHFCGASVSPGQTYCAEHAALAYQPAKRREDDKPRPQISAPQMPINPERT